MNNYKLYIGLFDKDTKSQLISTETAMKQVANEVISVFGFGTIYTGNGVYTHENGDVVVEPTIIVETSSNEEQLLEFIQHIGQELNQESIFYKVENAGNCVDIHY